MGNINWNLPPGVTPRDIEEAQGGSLTCPGCDGDVQNECALCGGGYCEECLPEFEGARICGECVAEAVRQYRQSKTEHGSTVIA